MAKQVAKTEATATQSKSSKSSKGRGAKAKYTEEQVETVVAHWIQCGNLSATSRQFSIPASTIQGFLAKKPPEEILQARLNQQLEAVRKGWLVVHKYFDHLLDPEVISKTNAHDAVGVAGHVIEKIQLLTGGSTNTLRIDGQVTERHEYDITHRIEQYADVYSKMAERGIPQGLDAGDGSGKPVDPA